jgi:hypothetical protein
VPVLGTVKTGSALAFDLGVVAIVVGLIIAVLDGFDATSLVDRGRTPAVAASTTTERSSNDDQSASPPGVAS